MNTRRARLQAHPKYEQHANRSSRPTSEAQITASGEAYLQLLGIIMTEGISQASAAC